jgi:hypothetical protein
MSTHSVKIITCFSPILINLKLKVTVQSSLQCLIRIFSTPINIRQTTLQMRPNWRECHCVKCPIKSWNILIHFSEIKQPYLLRGCSVVRCEQTDMMNVTAVLHNFCYWGHKISIYLFNLIQGIIFIYDFQGIRHMNKYWNKTQRTNSVEVREVDRCSADQLFCTTSLSDMYVLNIYAES